MELIVTPYLIWPRLADMEIILNVLKTYFKKGKSEIKTINVFHDT
jgi:hypothetical protein